MHTRIVIATWEYWLSPRAISSRQFFILRLDLSTRNLLISRTVVKQFGEYLATDPFQTLGIPTIPLEHDHGEFVVLDQVIDGLDIHQLDQLVADFFRKYKMGGVHGESEVKVTTLECR